jgi:hypothetical protein
MYGQTNTAELVKALQAMERIPDPGMPEGLAKATFEQGNSATSGLTYYDLEPGAKFLYPVLTPLRNSIARVSGKGGIQANWRAVTAINTENLELGVSQGNRAGVMAKATKDYTAAYKGLGLESSVTFEGQYAGQNFIDVRATAGRTLLESVMLGEEKVIFAGNASLALGVPPTPTVVAATTGGALAAATYDVRVVALSHQGLSVASVAGGIRTSITRTNADGSQDTYGGGSSNKSNAAAAVVGGSGAGKITASVAPVRGAFGYAWFWGVNGSDVLLGAITTVPTLVITAAATGTQNVTSVSADNSRNTLIYDGLITQALAADSGAYYRDLAGATLTADGAGGIVEIDTALQWFWDNWKLTPDTMWVSAQEAKTISQKILQGGAAPSNFRINVDMQQGMLAGGVMVSSYLNRFSMGGANVINIKIHPNAAPGMIFFFSSTLPYPISNVSNTIQILERQSYYQIEWPLRSRKYEYGVYYDGVLQHYAPFSMGVISGIGVG